MNVYLKIKKDLLFENYKSPIYHFSTSFCMRISFNWNQDKFTWHLSICLLRLNVLTYCCYWLQNKRKNNPMIALNTFVINLTPAPLFLWHIISTSTCCSVIIVYVIYTQNESCDKCSVNEEANEFWHLYGRICLISPPTYAIDNSGHYPTRSIRIDLSKNAHARVCTIFATCVNEIFRQTRDR